MPITIISEELRTALGKDLDTISAKLPEGKDFVLVLKDEHIPKSRFDEVNTTAKDYKANYEGVNAELEKLKPLAGNSEALKRAAAGKPPARVLRTRPKGSTNP